MNLQRNEKLNQDFSTFKMILSDGFKLSQIYSQDLLPYPQVVRWCIEFISDDMYNTSLHKTATFER